MKKSILVALMVILAGTPLWAGNRLINFQGKLTNSAGAALTGTYTVTFRLYSAPTGTTTLWTENQSVAVQNGLFSVVLGKVSSLDALPFTAPYYLGLQIAGDSSELAPRQMLGASAYAMGSLGDFNVKEKIAASSMTLTGSATVAGTLAVNAITLKGTDMQTSMVPVGTLLPFAGSTAPGGYLLCDGAAVSRSARSALFGIIGTAWGSGDGSTTFNLPDLRGRTPIGAGAGPGLSNRVVGTKLGEEAHVLTVVEMPSHTHTQTPHTHKVVPKGGGAYNSFHTGSNAGPLADPVGASPGNSPSFVTDNQAPAIASTGGGASHNTMQPSTVVNYIIKY